MLQSHHKGKSSEHNGWLASILFISFLAARAYCRLGRVVSGSGANIGTYYDLQKADVKQAILLFDWLSDTDTDIAAGSYQVGKDMNAGLYTYAIAENQAGSLQITTAE
ncbi:MAG: hypothetical protein RR816_06225, partial [Clostridia bacterium]